MKTREPTTTKLDLIQDAAYYARATQQEAKVVLEAMLGVIADCMRQGCRVEIRNFGTFLPRYRKARPARNPRTGAPHTLPANYTMLWRPSPEVKRLVDRGPG